MVVIKTMVGEIEVDDNTDVSTKAPSMLFSIIWRLSNIPFVSSLTAAWPTCTLPAELLNENDDDDMWCSVFFH